MKFFVVIRVGRLLAGVALVALTAVAGQEPAPKADEQSSPVDEIQGTIVSLDETCSSFVLLHEAVEGETETKFSLETGEEPWAHESEGCSFISLSGKKMVLNAGTGVRVRYLVEQNGNIIKLIVVLREPGKGPCVGQGGVRRTPATRYLVGCDGVPPPVCVYCPAPPFDPKSREEHVQGAVVLSIVVLPDGTVSEAKIVGSLNEALDKNAVETVRKWRFQPVIGPDGKPVTVSFPVQVQFRLQ